MLKAKTPRTVSSFGPRNCADTAGTRRQGTQRRRGQQVTAAAETTAARRVSRTRRIPRRSRESRPAAVGGGARRRKRAWWADGFQSARVEEGGSSGGESWGAWAGEWGAGSRCGRAQVSPSASEPHP